MSAQNAKKKRMGSRRRVANQDKTSESDEFHITDSASISQPCIPEECKESVDVSADPHDSQSETLNPTLPELKKNVRKLGSSRRKKDGLHVKDSATESYTKHREEKIDDNETPETAQMAIAIQPQRQEESSQGSEHDILSATHSSSLYLDITPDDSSEVKSSTEKECPEVGPDGLIPYVLGGNDKSNTLQREEPKENAHCVSISELTSLGVLTCSTEDQPKIDKSNSKVMPEEELPSVYSVTKNENKERDKDTEMLIQDEDLHVKSVVLTFPTTPEKISDKSNPGENTELLNSIKQEIFLSPNRELPKDEEQSEYYNIYEAQDAQHSEDAVNSVLEEEVMPTQMHEIKENVSQDATGHSEIISGDVINQAEVSNTCQSEFIVISTDDFAPEQDSNPEDKHDARPTKDSSKTLEHTNKDEDDHVNDTKKLEISDAETAPGQVYVTEDKADEGLKSIAKQTGNQGKEGIFSEIEEGESSLKTLDSKPLDNSVQIEEQTHTDFNLTENKRKLGSTRRNKGRQLLKESVAESYNKHTQEVIDYTSDNEIFETKQMLVAIERTKQEGLRQSGEHDIVWPVTHDSSLYSAIMPDYSSGVQNSTTPNYQETDLGSLIPKSENLQEADNERESDFNKEEVSDKLAGATLKETDKTDSLQSQEVQCTQHSEDAVNKVHEQEVKTVQEISHSFESVTDDATETSQLKLKQGDSNPDYKPDVHPTTENSFESSSPTDEDYHGYDTKKTDISDRESLDTAPGLVSDITGQVEDEQAELLSEIGENDSSLQTLQSNIHASLDFQPQQEDANFKPIGNRRKLGSSRRNKGRQHAKDPVAELHHGPTEEVVSHSRSMETFEIQKVSLTTETTAAVQEKSKEIRQEGTDTFDIAHTEEFNDQVQEIAHVDISERTSSSLHSTVHQQLIDQSNSTEMSEEELANLNCVTEKENKDENEGKELLKQDGSLQDNYLESESHLISVEKEFSDTPEISSEKDSPQEQTEPECNIEQDVVSSPKEDLPTNEEQQNEICNSFKVKDAHHLEDSVNSVPEHNVMSTQMDEISHFPENRKLQDGTEISEINPGDLIDQAEIRDTCQSNLTVKSGGDSATKQEDSNPDDKYDVHPTKDNNLEALERSSEDHLVYDSMELQTNDTEIETALVQVYDNKGQADDDSKPSDEQTGYQEKKGIISGTEETKSSLQTLHSETNAPLDSKPLDISVRVEEQTSTCFQPIENRRKLGSTRRNKGQQLLKESTAEPYHEHKEVIDDTSDNDAKQTLVAIERAKQEGLSQGGEHDIVSPVTHDSSLYSAIMPDYFSEVQSSTTPNYQETGLGSLIPKSESPQEADNERESDINKEEVSDKLAGATLKETDKTDSLQSQEVQCTHHSEDAVNRVHEQEVKTVQEISHSSDNMTDDATETSEIISGYLIDQAQISVTYQSELVVKSTDDFATMQDSNPDEKHGMHPTKEKSFEDLISPTNEDYHGYDTKKMDISDRESLDTAPGPVSDITGQVEDEQAELLSEIGENDSSLQTLQSNIHASLDFQPQQEDTNFKPIGNRRKLGSSRRNKGRQHAKDPVAELHHGPTEEVVSHTRSMETFEIQKASLTTETTAAVQEKSKEIRQEGTDTFDIAHTEEFNDQVQEIAHVGISERTSSSLHSTVHQQLIDQSNSTEMSEEELANLNSVTKKENKDENEGKELLKQDGSLQDNYLESESHLISAEKEFSDTPEISSEKDSPQEQTEPECNIEQDVVSSPKEDLPTNEEQQNEICNSFKVKDAHHLEDSVNSVPEHNVMSTQMDEISHFPENRKLQDGTEISEINPGDLIDQAEIRDTCQSNLTVKSGGDSATKQEDSNPDDKYDVHPTKDNNLEALERSSEDHLVYDSMELQTNDTEIETALVQVYENKGQADDDSKPSDEQTGYQEKKGIISGTEETKSSLQTLHSETNAPLDSKPLDISVRVEEQTSTCFQPIENRRKLGSTRRNKGQQLLKESTAEPYHEHKEVIDDTSDNDAKQTLVAIERTEQEGLSQGGEHDIVWPVTHDSSLYSAIMPDYFSEVQSSTTPNYQETGLGSLIPKSESPQEADNERESDINKEEVSDKLAGATLKETDKTDSLQSQEVQCTQHSENAVNKVHEQEVKTVQEISHSSDNVTDDATETSEIISGYLIDQAQISVTYQSELVVKSTDDFATMQDSNPDEKHGMHPAKEKSFEDLISPTNEDYHGYDTKKMDISDRESLDTAPGQVSDITGQVEDKQAGLSSEMGENNSSLQTLQSNIHASLDIQPQQEDTNFKPIGNRRKLGSSRRNKGRQNAKDPVAELHHGPTEEVVSLTRSNEPLEITKVLLTKDTAVQEISMESMLKGVDTFDSANAGEASNQVKENANVDTLVGISELTTSSLHASSAVDQQLIGQLISPEMPAEGLPNLKSVREKENKNEDEDTELSRQEETLQDNYLENESHLKSEDTESSIGPKIPAVKHHPGKRTEPECSVEQATLSSSQEELSSNEEQNVNANLYRVTESESEDVVNEVHEEAVKRTQVPEMLQIDFSEISIKTLHPEPNAPLDSQTQDNSVRTEEQTNTGFDSTRSRRKLGSSRRNKGRHLVKAGVTETYHKPREEFMENTRGDDALEQEDACQVQKTEAFSCEKESLVPEINMQRTNVASETMEDVTITDCNTEAESSMDVQVFGEKCEDPTKKDHEDKVEVAEEIPVKFVSVADIRDTERNVDVNVEPLQLDDFTSTEIHMTSVLTGRNASNTGITGGNFVSSFETAQGARLDEERQESIIVTQDQTLKVAEAAAAAEADLKVVKPIVRGGAGDEPSDTRVSIQDTNSVNEGADNRNCEMNNASPNLNLPRRRKMGSTRRNLISQSKREDFDEKQEEDNAAPEDTANVADVKTESLSDIKENEELQFHTEAKDSDCEQQIEKVTETAEYSHTGESNFIPPSHQSFQENPVSHGQLVETEHHLTPDYSPAIPSTSPTHDVMSERAGGRRRKLGSSRKSRGHQGKEPPTAKEDSATDLQNERDVESITEEDAVIASEEESLGLNKISEVDESDKKASSIINTEHSKPESEKTLQASQVQHPPAEIRLGQEGQQTFSLASISTGAAFGSKSYNVMMVGDSSVGKSSFMKRAQSGKFSLDLPASIGLDSCLWTVVVDGKPVALKLWDTAGQERFHSITRQIFHKAQAFLLMYDITSSQSFYAVRYWLNCIQEGAAENVTIVLLGNKSDRAERQVQTQEGENLAKEYSFEFMECSAATGENVIQSLEIVARMLSQKPDTREETSVLRKEPQQKKSSGCC